MGCRDAKIAAALAPSFRPAPELVPCRPSNDKRGGTKVRAAWGGCRLMPGGERYSPPGAAAAGAGACTRPRRGRGGPEYQVRVIQRKIGEARKIDE